MPKKTAADLPAFADLPTFDSESLASFYPAEQTQKRNVKIEINDQRSHRRRHKIDAIIDARQIANAAEHLDRLPKKDHAIHVLMNGNYGAWSLVPAILKLTGRKIRRLDIATLGFNQRMIDDVAAMLADGRVGHCNVIASHFFKSHESDGELFHHLHHTLEKYGGSAVATRSHAKVLLFEMAGRPAHYVIESSANLRSCRNLEQFVLINSKELLTFHRNWMTELHTKAAADATRQKTKTDR